jgi:hypothetical protein
MRIAAHTAKIQRNTIVSLQVSLITSGENFKKASSGGIWSLETTMTLSTFTQSRRKIIEINDATRPFRICCNLQ